MVPWRPRRPYHPTSCLKEGTLNTHSNLKKYRKVIRHYFTSKNLLSSIFLILLVAIFIIHKISPSKIPIEYPPSQVLCCTPCSWESTTRSLGTVASTSVATPRRWRFEQRTGARWSVRISRLSSTTCPLGSLAFEMWDMVRQTQIDSLVISSWFAYDVP